MYNTANVFLHCPSLSKTCESFEPKIVSSYFWCSGSFIPFFFSRFLSPLFWLTNLRSLGAKLTVSPFFLADVLVKEPQISKFWQPKNSLFYPLFSFSPTLLSFFLSPFPSFYFYFFWLLVFFWLGTRIPKYTEIPALVHARTLRARAVAKPPDIGILFFQLISSFLCQNRLCQLKFF